MILPK